jgi:hypothetical protein
VHIDCAGLKNKMAVAKPPNLKNVTKAVKRPGQTQPMTASAKAAKTAKGPAATKTATCKATKATTKAKAAAVSAAAMFSAVQKAGVVDEANTAQNDNTSNVAATDGAKPGEQAAKRDRKKASDINVEEAVAKVKAAKSAGTLMKLSLLELKAYLKSVGKPVGGKKAELVERVDAVVEP